MEGKSRFSSGHDAGRLLFINERGQFGTGTSDMKAALEMLIAFKIKISLDLFNIPSAPQYTLEFFF